MADAGVRPGVMVDQLEQLLLTAESERSKHDPMRLPDAQAAPSGKPRTSLHPGGSRPEPGEDRGKWSRNMPQVAGTKAAVGSTHAPAPSAAQTKPTAAVTEAEVVADSPPQQQPELQPKAQPREQPREQPESPPEQISTPATVVDKPLPAIAAAAAAVAAAKKEAEAKAKAKAGDQSSGAEKQTAPDGVATAFRKTPQRLVTPEPETSDDEGEVDPVMLAREFSRLLQMNSDDDEGSS
jgi:hypothetical protein